MEISSALSQSALFSGLSPRSLQAVASVSRLQNIRKRECLFTEGQKSSAIYLLKSGRIKLVKTAPDGTEVVIKNVEPGEVFAEATLFERDSYPVTATATSNSTVYSLPRHGILALFEEKSFRNDFITTLTKRVRYLTDRILYLSAYDVEDRFFAFLEELDGRKEKYSVAMSKKDIAASIGTTPETLSRLILRLKKAKLVSITGKSITVKPGFWATRL